MGVDGCGPDRAERSIAVVGASCRLPGGITDLDGLWRALIEGRDLITRVPADRFDAQRYVDPSMPRPGKSYTDAGGFLDDISGFDAAYFGISPKEAAQMDPQQRLLLELATEACDDAGIAPAALAGSDTAVLVGISDHSYGAMQMVTIEDVNAYTMSGAASSIAANRISHALDLRGPSLSVDTACSSSLVALAQGCQTLLAGACRAALVGGVNLLLCPYHYVGFSQASMLSPTGRCRSFSAGADGYVRAEGGGLVVLKRLADAIADGDRVHAVIVDSAVNCDGRTPGLALPRMEAQERLLRQVYARAGVAPDEIGYVEAHGTGTPVGDPIECEAIGRALGSGRTGGELPIGSIKSNLGHLEPASGIAGLLKALLVLRHGVVPPTLHALPPHPRVDFAALRLAPAVEPRELAVGARTVVGVNSFGFGGANAHVILAPPPTAVRAEAPPTAVRAEAPPSDGVPGRARPVVVSARSRAALAEAVRRMARRMADAASAEFYDLAWTASRRRGAHPYRAAVLADGPAQAARRLDGLAAALDPAPSAEAAEPSTANGTSEATRPSDAPPETPSEAPAASEPFEAPGTAPAVNGQRPANPVRESEAEPVRETGPDQEPTPGTGEGGAAVADGVARGRVVFAFSGNGAQWAGMGADLLAADPVFREAVDTVDALLSARTGWSVTEALTDPSLADRLGATEFAQPLLFAVQVALVEVLRRQGVRPAAVLGHSVGEIAAAHVAGALTLEQAVRVIAARGKAQAATAGSGRMAAVSLPWERAREVIEDRPGLTVACVNTGRDVTVSGPEDELAALVADLTGRGVACAPLDVDHAFHSSAMDPVELPLKAALDGLCPAPARVPMVSTVTGGPVEGTELDAEYWCRNVRQPVRFAPAVEGLLEDGYDVFVDIGPHPTLRPYLRRLTEKRPTPVAVVPTLVRGGDGPAALRTAVAALAAAGADLDWDTHFPVPGRVADLPAYPWQRERHWTGSPGVWNETFRDGGVDHPLLGDRLAVPLPTWSGPVEPVLVPWLADHRVGGSVVLPATGYVEMALAAGRRVLGAAAEVLHLEITRALVVPWDNPVHTRLQLTCAPEDGAVVVACVTGRTGEPTRHARCRVRRLLRRRPDPLDLAAVRERCAEPADPEALYRAAAAAGLDYGPAFRTLCELRVGDDEVLAAYRHEAPSDAYEIHPALLDGALQAGLPLMADAIARGHAYLPGAVDAVRVWRAPGPRGLVRVRERGRTETEVCWDITVVDEEGAVAAEVEGCRLRRFSGLGATPLIRHRSVLRAAPWPEASGQRSPLPAPSETLAAAAPRVDALRRARRWPGGARRERMEREGIALGFARACHALLTDPVAPFTVDDLVPTGKDAHRRLCALMLPFLERHGLVEREPVGGWRLTAQEFPVEEVLRRMAADYPADVAPITLASSRFADMAGVLQGTKDPMESFAEGEAELLEQFFDIAPWCRFHNRVLQALLSVMVDRWPADRPLRVLEVGAGTGGTTAALLPLLPPERTRYVFTDVSPLFPSRAERRFADHDFVEYRTFDLDLDPAEQGFAEGCFDLVVGANALHTAKDLAAALRRLNRLLAPGGQLLAFEMHDPYLLVPFFGTLESFWNRTDLELRPDTLLLPASRWPGLLAECGFTDVVRTGDGTRPSAAARDLARHDPHRPAVRRRQRSGGPPPVGGTVWI
ncbi:beta-ketoacyl synthase N-terminal-like domain-containing protein, partial [Streptomyces sp. URMC 123]|uniref:beta-ketoacyl synthase N-terminal-like domain-containing protein n=1 Tax=Streptomyces sp. URMC 123 TaxID=3423403 RepID=UPI003F1C9735